MKKRTLNLVIVLSLITLVLVSSFFILRSKKINDNSLNQKSGDNSVSENINKETTEEQTANAGGIESNDERGEDSATGNNENPIQTNCPEKQISYSMINFNKTSVCNENQSDVCIDKTVTCSMEIKNRDSEASGFFEVELTFREEENQNNVINKTDSRFFLEPEEKNKISDSISLQSTGIDGIANKKINCFFNTIEVPKKEVC